MAREQQKDLAQKFIDAQGKWDTDGISATLAEDAKHDLLPASLGVSQKDNAGKIETTKKLASALDNKPVNVRFVQGRALQREQPSGCDSQSAGADLDCVADQDSPEHPRRRATQVRLVHREAVSRKRGSIAYLFYNDPGADHVFFCVAKQV